MLEYALKGTKKYWGWIFLLSAIILVGVYFYARQFDYGLGITGLSRDVTWGFYIAQLTFLVGVAASGVMVVLPYYLHNYKAFGKLTILGEFLAIAAIVMCILFVAVDVGQPLRMINLILYPSPSSILFWDTVVLSGYLLLNVIISHTVLEAERKSVAPPKWIKPIIILIDSLGNKYSYGYSIFIFWSCSQTILDDCSSCTKISCICILIRTGAIINNGIHHKKNYKVRSGS